MNPAWSLRRIKSNWTFYRLKPCCLCSTPSSPLVDGQMELQQELAENALAAGNTTETLQKLVEAAGSAQRARGETPTVMVTIADHTGVASTAIHTTSYLSHAASCKGACTPRVEQ